MNGSYNPTPQCNHPDEFLQPPNIEGFVLPHRPSLTPHEPRKISPPCFSPPLIGRKRNNRGKQATSSRLDGSSSGISSVTISLEVDPFDDDSSSIPTISPQIGGQPEVTQTEVSSPRTPLSPPTMTPEKSRKCRPRMLRFLSRANHRMSPPGSGIDYYHPEIVDMANGLLDTFHHRFGFNAFCQCIALEWFRVDALFRFAKSIFRPSRAIQVREKCKEEVSPTYVPLYSPNHNDAIASPQDFALNLDVMALEGSVASTSQASRRGSQTWSESLYVSPTVPRPLLPESIPQSYSSSPLLNERSPCPPSHPQVVHQIFDDPISSRWASPKSTESVVIEASSPSPHHIVHEIVVPSTSLTMREDVQGQEMRRMTQYWRDVQDRPPVRPNEGMKVEEDIGYGHPCLCTDAPPVMTSEAMPHPCSCADSACLCTGNGSPQAMGRSGWMSQTGQSHLPATIRTVTPRTEEDNRSYIPTMELQHDQEQPSRRPIGAASPSLSSEMHHLALPPQSLTSTPMSHLSGMTGLLDASIRRHAWTDARGRDTINDDSEGAWLDEAVDTLVGASSEDSLEEIALADVEIKFSESDPVGERSPAVRISLIGTLGTARGCPYCRPLKTSDTAMRTLLQDEAVRYLRPVLSNGTLIRHTPDDLHHFASSIHILGTFLSALKAYAREDVMSPPNRGPSGTWFSSMVSTIVQNPCIDILELNFTAIREREGRTVVVAHEDSTVVTWYVSGSQSLSGLLAQLAFFEDDSPDACLKPTSQWPHVVVDLAVDQSKLECSCDSLEQAILGMILFLVLKSLAPDRIHITRSSGPFLFLATHLLRGVADGGADIPSTSRYLVRLISLWVLLPCAVVIPKSEQRQEGGSSSTMQYQLVVPEEPTWEHHPQERGTRLSGVLFKINTAQIRDRAMEAVEPEDQLLINMCEKRGESRRWWRQIKRRLSR